MEIINITCLMPHFALDRALGSFTNDVRTRGGGGCMAYADAGGRGEGRVLCRCGRPILNHLSSLKSFP